MSGANIHQVLEEYVATHPDSTDPTHLAQVIRDNHRGVISDGEVFEILRTFRQESTGFGVLEELLHIPGVSDIVVNGTKGVFIDRGQGLERCATEFTEDAQVRRLATRLIVAAGRRLDDSQCFADGKIARDHGVTVRVHAILAPPAQQTCISLRILGTAHARLADLVSAGTMSKATAAGLKELVHTQVPLLIIGGTGSGKTTLLSALLEEVPAEQRIIAIEDTAELAPLHPHFVSMISRPPNVEGQGAISLADLLQQSLRMRPNRIVVGEIRGKEIVELLSAMNTGHEGCAGTMHANTLKDVLARIAALGALGGMPKDAVYAQVAAAAPMVLVMARGQRGRYLKEIGRLTGSPVAMQQLWSHEQGDFQP
ncbi:MAG: TadA family conjugal transfer-associated ATPase [Corynebacterium sp.]|nr:TadA family conjugal transfer-associated ATPase [Corynebacterium sp.]